MTTPYTALDANIQATTRDLFVRSIKAQAIMQMPLLARLWMAKRVSWEGGTVIRRPVDKDDMQSLFQSYSANEPLSSGSKTLLDDPYFTWKLGNLPVQYNVETYLQNSGGDATKPIDLVKFLAKKAVEGLKIGLYRMVYGIDSTGTDYDGKKEFNSVVDALTHDRTYGHISRATTVTNSWWQGASIAGTYDDNATSYAPSIANFRKAVTACTRRGLTKPGGMLACCGESIFQELQSQVEARHIYNRDGSLLAKYGFNTMMIDGVEVVQDPFLGVEGPTTTGWTYPDKKFFIFSVDDWELRIHPQRNVKLTPFVWQGDRSGGADEWLARVLIAGNLVCWRPKGSIYLSNMA